MVIAGELTSHIFKVGKDAVSLATRIYYVFTLGLEKKLFVSCNGLKKDRVSRAEISSFFFLIIFWFKNVFYACFLMIRSQEGWKNFRVPRDFF